LNVGLDISPVTKDRFTVLPHTSPLQQSAVRDAAIAPGMFGLVVFSHTSLGHRRQSTFMCTHLASHGYVVAAPDHTGNTFADYAARASVGAVLSPAEREAMLARIIAHRVPDLRFVTDSLLSADFVDSTPPGVIGWSFGGWAALALPEVDARFAAVVALAPGGSRNPLPGIIPAQLTFRWARDVSTLHLVAERDRFTPLSGMHELFDRTPSAKNMFVLQHADHDHFGDHFEPELCPRWAAHLFTRSLALAHLDASLRSDPGAAEFLSSDPAAVLRARGVPVVAYSPSGNDR
jgi:dienelactone hydrolase